MFCKKIHRPTSAVRAALVFIMIGFRARTEFRRGGRVIYCSLHWTVPIGRRPPIRLKHARFISTCSSGGRRARARGEKTNIFYTRRRAARRIGRGRRVFARFGHRENQRCARVPGARNHLPGRVSLFARPVRFPCINNRQM